MSALFGPKKWFERTDLFVRQLTKTSGSKMRDMPRKSTQMLISKAKTTTIEFNCVSKILDITRIIVQICFKKAGHRFQFMSRFFETNLRTFWTVFEHIFTDQYMTFARMWSNHRGWGIGGTPPLFKNPVSAC